MAHPQPYFSLQPSPCCRGRVRVKLGAKRACLSWREARDAARALKDLADQAKAAAPRCGRMTPATSYRPAAPCELLGDPCPKHG